MAREMRHTSRQRAVEPRARLQRLVAIGSHVNHRIQPNRDHNQPLQPVEVAHLVKHEPFMLALRAILDRGHA